MAHFKQYLWLNFNDKTIILISSLFPLIEGQNQWEVALLSAGHSIKKEPSVSLLDL